MADLPSLKDANRLPLYALVLFNAVLFVTVVKSDSLLKGDFVTAARDITGVIPAGILALLVGFLNAQASALNKARLVFGRWEHPLPGAEAFSRYMYEDPRINVQRLTELCTPVPLEPEEQNSRWYELYRSVEADSSVRHVHREFLFARDYTALSLGILLTLGPAGFIWIPSPRTAVVYALCLIVQFLLARNAARDHGKRFVTTVLALKSVGR